MDDHLTMHKQKMQPVFEELTQYQQIDEVFQQKTQQQLENGQQAVQVQQQEGTLTYERFLRNMTPLSQRFAANGTNPADEKAASKKEKRKEKKQAEQVKQGYEKRSKELAANPRLLSKEDLKGLSVFKTEKSREAWAKQKLPHSELTREETLKQVLEREDYSNFENLDTIMRNMVATRALKKLHKDYGITENSNPSEICRQIKASGNGVSGLLNPPLRLALSLASHSEGISDGMKEFYRKLDEELTTEVMVETLTNRPDFETVKTYFKGKNLSDAEAAQKANEAIAANQAQKIQIAKRLLLMQISNFKVIDTDKDGKNIEEDWSHSMAVALSHCSRVVLTLPKVDNAKIKVNNTKIKETQNPNASEMHDKMWRSILTTGGVNTAQDNERGSSTHSLKRRKVDQDSKKFHKSKEKKVLFNFKGQRGMNCAIGGLGNAGVSGKTICNDGSCGHFYSMYMEGDETHYGAMLMGLESDAYGVTNQMGHTHDIHATGEKASSLGGQRTDEIGNKYGGRQCDLSTLSAKDITTWMKALEGKMSDPNWWNKADDLEKGDIGGVTFMRMLAGKKMMTMGNLGMIRQELKVGSVGCYSAL